MSCSISVHNATWGSNGIRTGLVNRSLKWFMVKFLFSKVGLLLKSAIGLILFDMSVLTSWKAYFFFIYDDFLLFFFCCSIMNDPFKYKKPQPIVWVVSASLESHLIERPASVNELSLVLPRCHFTSTLWFLVGWNSLPGQIRSEGLPRSMCQGLSRSSGLGMWCWRWGGDERLARLDEDRGNDWCSPSREPSSTLDPSLSHRVWAR